MEKIRIINLQKTFQSAGQEIHALQDINLTIAEVEFVCLLGPSGCGKSTLLNAVAGFIETSAGEVVVDGRIVDAPGPDRGVVFQEYALFPWMTVGRNVAFGLEIKGLSRRDIDGRVNALLHKLNLWEFRERFPKDLSGGMKQRVAIARVLAIDSPIMLMDEPFGALDALTRRSLQKELLRIRREFCKTIIFVTHSIEEAIYLADRIVVMTYRPGTIKFEQQVALPHPRDPAGAEFNELKRKLGGLVMEEHERHAKDEMRGEG